MFSTIPSARRCIALLVFPSLFGCQPEQEFGEALPVAEGGSLSDPSLWPELPPVPPAEEGSPSSLDPSNPWQTGGWRSAGGSAADTSAFPSESPESSSVSNDGKSALDPPEGIAPQDGEEKLPPLHLLLTRYEESPGADKRLELEARGRPIADGECALEVYANGSLSPFRKIAFPSLSTGETLRFCTSKVTDPRCRVSLGATSFNGNDALVVRCLGQVQDSLGRVGEDPGKAWSNGKLSTLDAILLRCGDAPDLDPFDPVDLETSWVEGTFDDAPELIEERCAPPGAAGAPAH